MPGWLCRQALSHPAVLVHASHAQNVDDVGEAADARGDGVLELRGGESETV